jgi:uncharacterized membrane protein
MPMTDLLRAAALGAATGARSSAGVAALSWTDGSGSGLLGSRAGRIATAMAAVTEAVIDTRPSTPSRLSPLVLVPRLVLGAVTAAVAARRTGAPTAPAALTGVFASAVWAVAAVPLRGAAARRLGSDLPGALAEDVLAALLGWFGASQPSR